MEEEDKKLALTIIVICGLIIGGIVIGSQVQQYIDKNKIEVQDNIIDDLVMENHYLQSQDWYEVNKQFFSDVEFNVKENCKLFNNSYYHKTDRYGLTYGCKLNLTDDYETDKYIKESIISFGSEALIIVNN